MTSSGSSRFSYTALLKNGSVERGMVEAVSSETAVRILADRGLWATDVRPQRRASRLVRRKPQMSVAPLALGLRILADFLEAGLPLPRALAAFEELAPAEWQAALPSVRDAVRQGKSLGTALSSGSVGVSPLVVGVVHAGEAGSGLVSAVRRAAEMTEESAAMRAAIRGALAYPIILASAGTVSLGLLTGMVLPRFAGILAELGQALPPVTRLVLDLAAIAKSLLLPGIIAGVLVAVASQLWISTDRGRSQRDAIMLQVPLLGSTRRSAATARVCAALNALLSSGVPLAQALVHASRAAGDAALASRLLAARSAVLRGDRLSRALADTNAATIATVRLVRAGEESGRLAAMLGHAARIEREEALRRTRSAVRLLEPGLIVGFGAIVALIAAAMLQALYSVRPGA